MSICSACSSVNTVDIRLDRLLYITLFVDLLVCYIYDLLEPLAIAILEYLGPRPIDIYRYSKV